METIRKENRLLLETVRGSHLFGLATPESDLDTYGVFCGPPEWFLGLGHEALDYVSSEKNDDSWSELRKYGRELGRSNPDALCSLFTPPDLILHMNPIFQDFIDLGPSLLTKECFKPFSSYALGQIKKAKGLKKAINTDPKEVKVRKTPLDFCYVPVGCGAVTLRKWLAARGLDQTLCGLTRIPNGIETYALYYDGTGAQGYRGVVADNGNQLRMSGIPKEAAPKPECTFQFNSGAYTQHCTDYKRYHDWVKNRNQARYDLNKGYDFDSKNMCHCVRILTMAKEIAQGQGMILNRTGRDREFLLDIKNHKIAYPELMEYTENLEAEMLEAFKESKLPESPDLKVIDEIMIKIRKSVWKIY